MNKIKIMTNEEKLNEKSIKLKNDIDKLIDEFEDKYVKPNKDILNIIKSDTGYFMCVFDKSKIEDIKEID